MFDKPLNGRALDITYQQKDLVPFNRANQTFVGPTLAPLKPYFNRMTLFNGLLVSQEEVGHPSPTSFMLAGQKSGISTWVSTAISSILNPQALYVLQQGNIQAPVDRQTYHLNFDIIDKIRESSGSGFSPSRPSTTAEALDPIAAIYQELKRTQSRLQRAPSVSLASEHPSYQKTMIQSMLTGVANSFFMSPEDSFDSHSNYKSLHAQNLTKCFSEVALLLKALSSHRLPGTQASLLDHTHIVITSEFTRIPTFNGTNDGKEHNPYANSMIVISSALKGGEIIGQSRLIENAEITPTRTPIWLASPLSSTNFQVQLENEAGRFVPTATHVFATLFKGMGILEEPRINEEFKKVRLILSALRS